MGSSAHAEIIGYGSRAGMVVTVMSKYGIGSKNAIINVKHTRENAIEYCREYEGTTSKKCIEDELRKKLERFVSANCESGLFSNFYGEMFTFEGKNNKPQDPESFITPEYIIQDNKTSQPLDGTSASGYDVNLDIYKALCPKFGTQKIEQ